MYTGESKGEDMEFEKIQKIIADVLNYRPEEIKPETKFIDDLGADSLDLFQIILEIEQTFEISISDDQIENITTVNDAVEAIKKAVNG